VRGERERTEEEKMEKNRAKFEFRYKLPTKIRRE
jgi:hypothetical protein